MKRVLDDSELAKVAGGGGFIDDPPDHKPPIKGGPRKPTSVPEVDPLRAPLADYDPE
jgi:hypothetical protein